MKKKQIELPEGCTPEMVAKWKEKYGKEHIKISELPTDETGDSTLSVVLRVPDRRVVGMFERHMERDPDKSKEIMVKNCTLFGLEQVLANDGLFFTCFSAIADLIPIRKALTKNL